MKILKLISLIILSLVCVWVIALSECKEWIAVGSILGVILGLILPEIKHAFEDLSDTTNWKVSQRQLTRGGTIKKDTIVRISFAYLYRIQVDGKYLLVRNERNTGKYQPVGGVYKFTEREKHNMKNLFHVIDDNKISIDDSSRDDYRLQLENRYLRKFIKRFNNYADRENTKDLSREFKEELIDKGILNWDQITYRICGRHMTKLEFGQHFQIYEILLADVVELLPTEKQRKDLQALINKKSDVYRFVTADKIKSLGVNTAVECLQETIADHAQKILQENESKLMRLPDSGKKYTVEIKS